MKMHGDKTKNIIIACIILLIGFVCFVLGINAEKNNAGYEHSILTKSLEKMGAAQYKGQCEQLAIYRKSVVHLYVCHDGE